MVIELLREEFTIWSEGLPKGITATLQAVAQPGASGQAARLDVEASDRLIQATVWESGETDLVVGDVRSGDLLVNEHREITSRIGIQALLDDVLAALVS